MSTQDVGPRVERTLQGWMAHDERRGLAWVGASEDEAAAGLESVTRLVRALATRWAEWHRAEPGEPR